jgi:hypothetical protein
MVGNRKKAVSIRMVSSDVRKVKKLAQRLGARDSDIIRYAVRLMVSRLEPLTDPEVRGRNLLPVFVESGEDLLRFFDLDASRLEAIINEGADASRRVEHEDIALLAMSGAQQPYAALKLHEINGAQHAVVRSVELSQSLRTYLYQKYLHRHDADVRDDERRAEATVLALAAGGRHD